MKHKFVIPTFLALFALMLFACSPTTETVETSAEVEPVAAVVEEEAVMAEEEMGEMEEMAEESHDNDSDESMEEAHSDAEMADEEMEEKADSDEAMAEDEMAEGESMEAVYVINSADSEVLWKGAKAVGDFHTGTIDVADGSLTVTDGSLVSGSFVLDMTSIVSNDGANARLVSHLKDADFFGVDVHPTAMLIITSAELIEGDQYNVQADLTIKDITNPIEFVATATEADGQLTAVADIVFDRAQFDVQYGSGTFFSGLGNDLINDEVEITVSLVAAK
ncbi:MAG: YceI family protein [Anaerolineae bacterium]